MPEQSHPPYVSGALTIPRQLKRWLDINPQNGPLERTKTFVTIPGFEISNINWRGFSEVVAEWHVTATNNFSLKIESVEADIPQNPSYTLCIAYVDQNNNTFRYRLWSSPSEVIYFTIPEYTGQPINSTFKIEVWSTNVAQILNPNPTTIYTSVLGNQDYRYGLDTPLVTFGAACVNQQVPIDNNLVPPAFDLPIIFNVCGVTGGNVIIIGGESSGIVLGGEP